MRECSLPTTTAQDPSISKTSISGVGASITELGQGVLQAHTDSEQQQSNGDTEQMPNVDSVKLNADLPTIKEWKSAGQQRQSALDRLRTHCYMEAANSTPSTLQYSDYKPARN